MRALLMLRALGSRCSYVMTCSDVKSSAGRERTESLGMGVLSANKRLVGLAIAVEAVRVQTRKLSNEPPISRADNETLSRMQVLGSTAAKKVRPRWTRRRS